VSKTAGGIITKNPFEDVTSMQNSKKWDWLSNANNVRSRLAGTNGGVKKLMKAILDKLNASRLRSHKHLKKLYSKGVNAVILGKESRTAEIRQV